MGLVVGFQLDAVRKDAGIIFQIGDLFARKIGWEPFRPKLVFPLDFAFGLGSRSIEKTNVIKSKLSDI